MRHSSKQEGGWRACAIRAESANGGSYNEARNGLIRVRGEISPKNGPNRGEDHILCALAEANPTLRSHCLRELVDPVPRTQTLEPQEK